MTLDEFLKEWHDDNACMRVQTSGSTGEPKPMLVEKQRMQNSARITCSFLGLKAGDTALLCMPLDYIAGKMMVVRALTCGLRLVDVPPSGHPLARPLPPLDFAAMVPMQVYNSLQVPEERRQLMSIHHLIIGGGAIDDALEQELRTFPHAVWSTYGMTETLSHVALRRLNGPQASPWYTPFDTVSLSLSPDGCLVIDAPLVCSQTLTTHDVAEMDGSGRFRILGRLDNIICSGGIKIQIEEVERLLAPHTPVPLMITKCKDKKFGEAVVLLAEKAVDMSSLETLCRQVLPRFWQPKHYVAVNSLPYTETGKPARREACRLASLAIEV